MYYTVFTEEQSRELIDASQIYTAYRDAIEQSANYFGSMIWKKVNGCEYLYRLLDRRGNAKSLGPRCAKTEAQYTAFMIGKQESKQRVKSLKAELDNRARYCKAARINRVPVIVANIARRLDKNDLLGKHITIIGTNAIYGYESMAAVRMNSALTATRDVDILWDARGRLKLVGDDDIDGLLPLLQKVDNSFKRSAQTYRAVNKQGFMVDLIKPMPKSIMQTEPQQIGKENDLVAAEINSMKWLVASPKVSSVAIDSKGYPFRDRYTAICRFS
ncbi:MAG: GSU2403 family nucleotidyltransferase fold protein [Pseudomonadota bacterium]